MLAAPPAVPDCIEGFARNLRFCREVQRVTYDPLANAVYTIIDAPRMDEQVTDLVIEAEEGCLEHWPDELPVVRFEIINLGDFPESEHETLRRKYQGVLTLLP